MNLFGLYRLMEYFISEFSLFQTFSNGGNAWESNPAPGSHRDNGFEDRDGHQPRNHPQILFIKKKQLKTNLLVFSAP